MEHNERRQTDRFPEVTMAYESLEKTAETSKQKVTDTIYPAAKETEKLLQPILVDIAEHQGTADLKYINLGPSRRYSYKETFKGDGVTHNTTTNVFSRKRYLYWGNPEKGIETYEIIAGGNDKHVPESNEFEGFEKQRIYSASFSRFGLNLPNPPGQLGRDWIVNDKVFSKRWDHDEIETLISKNNKDKGVETLIRDYHEAKQAVEDRYVDLLNELAPYIKKRVSQLVDSIKEIGWGLFLPKYVPIGENDLRYEENKGVFFIPRKMENVYAPLLPSSNKLNAKPFLSKGNELAEPFYWFDVAKNSWQIVDPLVEKFKWKRP